MSEDAHKSVKYAPVPRDEYPPPRFTPAKCNDLPWAIAFLVQLVAMLVIGLYYFGSNYYEVTKSNSASNPGRTSLQLALKYWLVIDSTFGIILGSVFFEALFLSIIWLYIMKRSPRFIIWFSFISTIVLLAGLTIYYFYRHRYFVAVLFLILFIIFMVGVFFIEKLMAFSIVCLEVIVEFVERFPSTVFVAIAFVFVQAVWLCLWILGVVGIVYALNKSDPNNNAMLGFVMFLMALSFFWASQVIKNIVHMTTAGCFASWFFNHPDQMPDNPTHQALNRAMTTSFGSICLGSLLIAIIRALRFMVTMTASNDFLRVCGECILSCFDSIVQFFNLYAFTKCAVYGLSYCQAAKEVWRLLEEHGFLVVVNNDLIGIVLLIGSLIGGAFGALLAGVISYNIDSTRLWVYVVLGFLIGLSMAVCAMEVVDSASAALLVCFADDPEALAEAHPLVFQKLQRAFRDFYQIDVGPDAHGAA